jgi:hypothetical protein
MDTKDIDNLVTIMNSKLSSLEERIKEFEYYQEKMSSIIDTIIKVLEIQHTRGKECQKNF